MKFQIRTNVTQGQLKRNRNLIIDALNHYEGKDILITIEKAKKKRSNPQNAYMWSLLYPIAQQAFKNEWGEVWTIQMVHEFFKAQFLHTEKVNEETGEVVRIPKSTTENSTTQQEEYHEEIRRFLQEWFNVIAPLPNESLTLKLD